MGTYFHRISQFVSFYYSARTKYQIHSPFVFELVNAVLDDDRTFYAFRDIEMVRQKMLESDAEIEVTDFGAGMDGNIGHEPGVRVKNKILTLKSIARKAGSSPTQSRRLFRLAQHFQPKTMVELGTSVGIGSMYMASAARNARFLTLEGSNSCADIAQVNLDLLGLKNVEVVKGAFENTLRDALESIKTVDFMFFDGNHRKEPTITYFEMSLDYAHENSVFIFDDIYWSQGMTEAWEYIKQHPKVTLTVNFFDVAIAFFSPDHKVKQHFEVVPTAWKPWKIY